jgi:hypothetical protein
MEAIAEFDDKVSRLAEETAPQHLASFDFAVGALEELRIALVEFGYRDSNKNESHHLLQEQQKYSAKTTDRKTRGE